MLGHGRQLEGRPHRRAANEDRGETVVCEPDIEKTQRLAAPGAHGHAAAMAAGAVEFDADHGGRGNGRHHPDFFMLLLQQRPLLDVQLQEGIDLVLRLLQRPLCICLRQILQCGSQDLRFSFRVRCPLPCAASALRTPAPGEWFVGFQAMMYEDGPRSSICFAAAEFALQLVCTHTQWAAGPAWHQPVVLLTRELLRLLYTESLA